MICRFAVSGSLLILSGVLVAGCGLQDIEADNVGEESALATTSCGSGDADDRIPDRDHRFHRRSEHYRRHRKHHRKCDPTAQLTVRALMDRARTTSIEATTGTFDDGTVPPGEFDRVRIDVTAISPKHRIGQLNFDPGTRSGYFSTSLPRLVHGQTLSLAARIIGLGRKKTDLSVEDQVMYRPDLAVRRIDMPAQVAPGMATSIAATVAEMMGDTGAKGNCVLSVDGAVVDHANGIWVDAGSAVTCQFAYAFAGVGTHKVHVDVTNVEPGDYDVRNNGGDATVDVTAEFKFSASASDSAYAGSNQEDITDSSGVVLFHQADSWSGALQSVSLNGVWPMTVTFPLVSVSATATSGGTTWPLLALSGLPGAVVPGSAQVCASGGDTDGFNWITICSSTASGGQGTQISVTEFAGDVTYHSEGACLTTSSVYDCSGGYTWNSGSDSSFAAHHPFGQMLTIGLNVSDAVGLSLQASPQVALSTYANQNEVPLTCVTDATGARDCTQYHYLETGASGGVSQ